MATKKQVSNFISQLSALAVAEYKKRKNAGRKWVLPSVCIAQAALETGWGTSPLMVKANAYFGIKAGTGWTGRVYSTKTQECYNGRDYTTITDLFRAYGSLAESVADYYDLITGLDRYAKACNQSDAKKCIQAIKDGGYATSPTYVTNVMSIINQYGLTEYDKVKKETSSMTKTEKAIHQMEEWANDNSHGYDQIYRWGERGDYDCSSAVIMAWQLAGIPVKSKGATYTGNMYNAFLGCGFKDVTKNVNLATGAGMQRGDVLLNHMHHVAMFCGNGKEVEASINEKGTATGGQPGDQTGKEFLIRPYRNYPWNVILRYPETAASSEGENYMFEAKTVKKGEVGNHVLLVQEILRARKFKGANGKALKLDKNCGDETVYAIKQYQKTREKQSPGIVGAVDGIAGPKTLQDMIAL
ncbi:MAG: glucosaminidase domain-containing protein [Lachnospiraceae bacterium]|nr:glucosaminidase domain-containing protein [Lachnospiraceae bacterium]